MERSEQQTVDRWAWLTAPEVSELIAMWRTGKIDDEHQRFETSECNNAQIDRCKHE